MTTVRATIAAVLNGALGYEDGLDALAVAAPPEVDAALMACLDDACAAALGRGWQPAELHRVVARRGRPEHAALLADAIARGRPRIPAAATYLAETATRRRIDRLTLLDEVLTLVAILVGLPAIDGLGPPPGTGHANGSAPRVDLRHLERVRALLAKAESTTHTAEAEAYTAKAQELAARHSIDEALLSARSGTVAVVPFARRIGVDHPHEGERAALLDVVARANRCQVVWSPEFGFATVFGFDSDLDTVELLYTSLLVQAHRDMARSEPAGGKAGRTRLRSFRQSFLVAFSVRIGERLTAATQAALAEATQAGGTDRLLPVLLARDAEVRQAREKAFPRTVRSRGGRVDSRDGWESGQASADRAQLPSD